MTSTLPERCEHGCYGYPAGSHCGCCARLTTARALLRRVLELDSYCHGCIRIAANARPEEMDNTLYKDILTVLGDLRDSQDD